MVNKPHLTPKKIGAGDRKAARKMQGEFVRGCLAAHNQSISAEALDALLGDEEYRDAIALCTYAADLLQRLEGVAVGTASLALWRTFAWTAQGSPKQGFQLTADAILQAKGKLEAKFRVLDHPVNAR